jgi:hypothetical protein
LLEMVKEELHIELDEHDVFTVGRRVADGYTRSLTMNRRILQLSLVGTR